MKWAVNSGFEYGHDVTKDRPVPKRGLATSQLQQRNKRKKADNKQLYQSIFFSDYQKIFATSKWFRCYFQIE